MKLQLRHYDNILMTFEFTSSEREGRKLNILSIDDSLSHLLPIGMERTDDGVMSWLKNRVVPQNREFVDQLLSKNGLSTNDTLGIIKLCKGLSVNDSYWVTEEDFDGKFADYNLYENEFRKALALVAYTGYGSIKPSGFTSSPEFTTNGMLRKGWRKIGGRITLYKGGTFGGANTGNEPYSEYYASQIAKKMGLNFIEYGLSMWKHNLCSTCELFTDINTAYVPVGRIIKKGGLLAVEEYFKGIGEEFYNGFVDMLIFDAVICNTDRHFGNFGILVDSKTNKIKSFAPIFDNGYSLFNFAMMDDLANINAYAKTRIPANAETFLGSAALYISKRQKDALKKLINFKFEKHPTYNLPSVRLKKIEEFIQIRVAELLNIENK